jgi:hypothetical protein
MKSAEEIEQAIRDVEMKTRPSIDERILADAVAALPSTADAGTINPSPVLWKRIVKNPWFVLGTAAAALFAVVVGLHYLGPESTSETTTPAKDTFVKNENNTDAIPITTPGDLIPKIEPKMVELKLELPKPVFITTPMDYRMERLEPQRREPRPTLLVLEGTRNLALGKPVTSSDPKPLIGSLKQITDGMKEAIEGSWVELKSGAQWIQIDLEQTSNIYAIIFWHNHQLHNVYYDVAVQVSNDPDFAEAITLFNNDHDNSLGLGVGQDLLYIETYEGKLIDTQGIEGRYVRLYSRGNYRHELNDYTEVEAYGVDE